MTLISRETSLEFRAFSSRQSPCECAHLSYSQGHADRGWEQKHASRVEGKAVHKPEPAQAALEGGHEARHVRRVGRKYARRGPDTGSLKDYRVCAA